ncbi:sec-independent protein translocase protein TatB [Zhongshania antarctica]|jgi:sec-independent protein translocase protein TatB|uniref:Sec-independent protein translocase protein TatB n=1 Tax=Zhongshania antarctica TaxID=641702 RepID=A0A840R7C6_9GAMM|nr:Sec-independent protein translocase protein TatB [Zhongshania antarctica]MBB5189209.1 sec-independent protein translocase protein TatB [Zhongshania antarctica]
MFDMSFLELVVVAIVGLLVVGPERLPQATRTGLLYAGKIKNEFKKIRYQIEKELDDEGFSTLKSDATSSIEGDLSILKKNWHKEIEAVSSKIQADEPPNKEASETDNDTSENLHSKTHEIQ